MKLSKQSTPDDRWRGPTLKRSLGGKVPLLIVNRSHQNAQRLPEVFDHMSAEHGNTLGVGSQIRLPGMSASRAESFMSDVEHVPVRIADPELWRVPGSGWPSAKPLNASEVKWPYLTPTPAKVSGLWARSVLDAQKNSGASVLLTATGWLGEANGAKALASAMDWVEESRRLIGDEPMWVNLTMDSKWLSDTSLRNALIDEIVESSERAWYLRFWWPEVKPRYGQLLDDALLRGYRELATATAVEGKRIYLANSGLTGWVATALGASGFSTGQAWGEQAFAAQRPMGSQKGAKRPPKIPRIFDSTVLHTMDFNEYSRLRGMPKHREYSSPYSVEIDAGGHTPERASLHYLLAVGELTASLNGTRPNFLAHNRARRGQRFIDSLSPVHQLNGISKPLHLAPWMKLLR